MKHLLVFCLVLLTKNIIAAENNEIIGTWQLYEKVVMDFDGEHQYENFNEYIKIKSNIYKSQLTPMINTYTEFRTISFNEDYSGEFLVSTLINNYKAKIDWLDKTWNTDETDYVSKFNWEIKEQELYLKFSDSTLSYTYNIIDLGNESKQLEILPITEDLEYTGIFKNMDTTGAQY